MAAEIVVRGVLPGDAEELFANLRAADRAELLAAGVPDILQCIKDCPRGARLAFTATVDGKVGCMLGVTPVSLLGNTGVPWMLGTDLVTQYRGALGRRVGKYIRMMLDEFDILRNYVHAENEVAVRWLQRVGFTLHAPVTLPSGAVFYPFEMRSANV